MHKLILYLVLVASFMGCTTAPSIKSVPVENTVTFTGEYVTVKEADIPPRPVFQTKPIYPRSFRKAGVGGSGTIAFIVEIDGTTSELQVKSATDVEFGEAAKVSVSQWRFKPGQKDGRTVRVAIEVPIKFAMRSD